MMSFKCNEMRFEVRISAACLVQHALCFAVVAKRLNQAEKNTTVENREYPTSINKKKC
jgi:hypothetical protein